MNLIVYRSAGPHKPRYDSFEIEVKRGMTVLDALFQARDEVDDSLSFRYSCRGAVCGSCAMLINGRPMLACRTQLEKLLEQAPELKLAPFPAAKGRMGYDADIEVLVEPLPNLPVIKDLAVDMTSFFEKLEQVEPYLVPLAPIPEREYMMERKFVNELEKFTNCILCAACYGACPVNAEDASYTGPAALAQAYRFAIDPRDERGKERLAMEDKPSGWPACRFYSNCHKVCPKGVPPNYAISKARKELSEREKGA